MTTETLPAMPESTGQLILLKPDPDAGSQAPPATIDPAAGQLVPTAANVAD